MRTNCSSAWYRPLALVLLLFAFGCVSQGPAAPTSNGVSVVYFKPDIETVSEGGRIAIAMLVFNGGFFPATDVRANLYLHGGFDKATWDQSLGSLQAANIELGTGGESKEVLWDMTAPKLTRDETTYPFNFRADISYSYQSSTKREVPVLVYNRVLELKQSGRGLPVGSSSSLDGPVSVRIATDEPVVRSGSGDNKEFEVKIILTNAGSGYVKSSASVKPDGDCFGDALGCIDKVYVTIPSGLSFSSCGKDNNGIFSQIKLVEGKQAVLSCKIIASTAQDEYTPVITGSVEYRYHIDASALVTVIK
jgi:hypothetical protein